MTATLIDAPPANTPEWVEWRRGGLGASELATVLGLDPYQTEFELWQVKTGRAPGFAGNPRSRWGHRLERVGIEYAESINGEEYRPNSESFQHPAYGHLYATPDAISATSGKRIGIEVKVTAAWVHPPERIRVQALAQAGICGFERVDIVRLNFEDDPAIFRIERDEAAIESILAAGEAWYVHHVLEGVEPPRRPDEVIADERQVALAADLRRVKKAIEQLERQERAIRDDLIASVAGAGVITGQGFRIEVRAGAPVTRTSWKDVAEELTADWTEEHMAALFGKFQTTSRRGPSVYPSWTEEES